MRCLDSSSAYSIYDSICWTAYLIKVWSQICSRTHKSQYSSHLYFDFWSWLQGKLSLVSQICWRKLYLWIFIPNTFSNNYSFNHFRVISEEKSSSISFSFMNAGEDHSGICKWMDSALLPPTPFTWILRVAQGTHSNYNSVEK